MERKCLECGKLVIGPFLCCSEKCDKKIRKKDTRICDSVRVSYEAYCEMVDFFNMEMGGKPAKPFTRKEFNNITKELQDKVKYIKFEQLLGDNLSST